MRNQSVQTHSAKLRYKCRYTHTYTRTQAQRQQERDREIQWRDAHEHAQQLCVAEDRQRERKSEQKKLSVFFARACVWQYTCVKLQCRWFFLSLSLFIQLSCQFGLKFVFEMPSRGRYVGANKKWFKYNNNTILRTNEARTFANAYNGKTEIEDINSGGGWESERERERKKLIHRNTQLINDNKWKKKSLKS